MMNPGTALGIAAAQLAQQGQYKPFTSDGKPTVVNNLITQESQKEAAKQAQTAAQIEAMKQARMQQELQQMLAQKTAPQAPLASGIGSLGADVPMAEGGVVGYAEGGMPRTYGYAPDYEDARRLGINLSPYDAPEVRQQKLERLQKMREFEGQRKDFGEIPTEASVARDQALQQAFSPQAQTRRMMDVTPSGVGIATPAPRPPSAPRRQPTASPAAAPAAPMLPDTRESTAVNPSEAALQYAQMQGGLKELFERQNKPRERTPEELKEAAAREEDVKRRMDELDASKARFEQAKQERLAGQQGQGLRDLASFLSSAGGARSGLAGLGQATLRMDPILAARAAQEQQFREQELVFMDKLGERRNLVNDLRLSSLKDEAGRAREDVARLRALDMEISKLGLGLGEKRAGELAIAEREREKTAATAKEGELNRAKDIKVAQIGAAARTAAAEGRGALTPRDIARFRAQAEKDVDTQLKADPSYVSMKVRNPTAAETYRTDLIDKRLKRVLADEGFGEATPAPAAGQLSPEVLSQFKVRPVGQ